MWKKWLNFSPSFVLLLLLCLSTQVQSSFTYNQPRIQVSHCLSTALDEHIKDGFKITLRNNPTCPCDEMTIICQGVEKDHILQLIDKLHRHCLALQVAFQYINEYQRTASPTESDEDDDEDTPNQPSPILYYISEHDRYSWIPDEGYIDDLLQNYTKADVATFLSIILRHDQLVKSEKKTYNLLHLISFYSPRDIPIKFVMNHPHAIEESHSELMAMYEATSIISYNADKTLFHIHPLVHDAISWVLVGLRESEGGYEATKLVVAKLLLQMYVDVTHITSKKLESHVLKHAKTIRGHMARFADSDEKVQSLHEFGIFICEKLLLNFQFVELVEFSKEILETDLSNNLLKDEQLTEVIRYHAVGLTGIYKNQKAITILEDLYLVKDEVDLSEAGLAVLNDIASITLLSGIDQIEKGMSELKRIQKLRDMDGKTKSKEEGSISVTEKFYDLLIHNGMGKLEISFNALKELTRLKKNLPGADHINTIEENERMKKLKHKIRNEL